MLVLVAGPMMLKRQRVCSKHRALLILRGVSGALGAFTYYAAIAQVPLAETMALVNLSPFVVTILASIFLKEKCGKRHIAALLISFLGALCIIRPNFNTLNTGYLIAFASAVITGCSYTLVRKLKQDVDTQTIVFYYCIVSVLFSLAFMGFSGFVWPSLLDWFKLVCLGVVAQLFNWTNTSAYKYAPAGKIAIFGYMSIFCSALFGIVLWNEYLVVGTVIGILLIFSGAFLSFYNEKTENMNISQ